jgi:hypothetical protein
MLRDNGQHNVGRPARRVMDDIFRHDRLSFVVIVRLISASGAGNPGLGTWGETFGLFVTTTTYFSASVKGFSRL